MVRSGPRFESLTTKLNKKSFPPNSVCGYPLGLCGGSISYLRVMIVKSLRYCTTVIHILIDFILKYIRVQQINNKIRYILESTVDVRSLYIPTQDFC